MLDDISGYSVDKAKFWIECDPEELDERCLEWQGVFGGSVGPQGGKVYNVQSVKRGERDGTYYYAFDVWGEAASKIDLLEFALWYQYLDRVDLKVTMPMTEEGRDNYRDYLKEKLNGNRSIRLMDSPQRQKRGSRDAGGHTLALGSHKSDYRVHWTLRGSETGYQEFQLEGTRIAYAVAIQRMYASGPTAKPDKAGWLELCKCLLLNANLELSDLDGLYDSDRGAILAGREDIHGVMERKLDYIESYISRLPKSALYGLYQALELKLFGEPPETEGMTAPENLEDTLVDEEE